MPRMIAVANMKGGVGKTTISMMLAEALAFAGKRVLLVDLDAQGSLSFCLMGSERFQEVVEDGKTLSKYFAGRGNGGVAKGLTEFIVRAASLLPTCSKLDLVAAEPALQQVERDVIARLSRFSMGQPLRGTPENVVSQWLKSEMQTLNRYEFIVFDCPPGISIFAVAGIATSDAIIVPTTPDYLSMLAVRSMRETALPNATGRRKRKPSVSLLLNKCRGGTTSPQVYRERLSTYITDVNWDAALSPIQLPLKQKLADAVETEDREWNTFKQKYDIFDTQQLVSLVDSDITLT